jgi:hypothetical protein
MRRLAPRFSASLDVSTFTDSQVHVLIGNIKLVGPKSPIVSASQPLQTSLAALIAKDDALTASNKMVADDRQKLRTDLATEAQDRTDLHGEVRTYAALLVAMAKAPADLELGGLTAAPPRPSRNTPPDVPQRIDNKPPKKGHGKTVVSVHETGPTRGKYVAESSLDGINYSPLGVHQGKTRAVTGPSGTKVWVRFARVRGGLQSGWSVPILVTIP